MKKSLASTAAAVMMLATAACGTGYNGETDSEGHIACYTAAGKFKEYDDDCRDDGLYSRSELERLRASQKAAPSKNPVVTNTVAPSKKPYRRPPRA